MAAQAQDPGSLHDLAVDAATDVQKLAVGLAHAGAAPQAVAKLTDFVQILNQVVKVLGQGQEQTGPGEPPPPGAGPQPEGPQPGAGQPPGAAPPGAGPPPGAAPPGAAPPGAAPGVPPAAQHGLHAATHSLHAAVLAAAQKNQPQR